MAKAKSVTKKKEKKRQQKREKRKKTQGWELYYDNVQQNVTQVPGDNLKSPKIPIFRSHILEGYTKTKNEFYSKVG